MLNRLFARIVTKSQGGHFVNYLTVFYGRDLNGNVCFIILTRLAGCSAYAANLIAIVIVTGTVWLIFD